MHRFRSFRLRPLRLGSFRHRYISVLDDFAVRTETFLENTFLRIVQLSPHQILQPVLDEMDRLQEVLLRLDETSCSKIRANVNAADELIKEAVWEFEDLLESHVFPQILPQLESERDNLSFSVVMLGLKHHVDCFVKMVKMMEEEYIIEVKNMAEEEGEPISSRIYFGGIQLKMVGLSDYIENARDYLLQENNKNPYWISGMAGIGKTTIAKHIFEDPSIRCHFEFRAWVAVGRKCESNELLRCVLAQVDPNAYQMLTQGDDHEKKLVGLLKQRLKGKKCLVVLDDVWEKQVTKCLRKKDIVGRIRLLLTSRLQIVCTAKDGFQRVRLLNTEESNELLGEKVFGEEGFPLQLEKLGEEIAWKCEGLPLMIVTVAKLLSKADKTPVYWTEVAYKQHNSLFEDAYNQISEVLFPSYDYLPQQLKMCFLYIGAFRPYTNISPKLINPILSVEGFLILNGEKSFEGDLEQLTKWYHLVLDKSNSWYMGRQFRVHSCWQHLCKVEASRIKHMIIIKRGVQSYMPVQIWDMQELEHLEILGRDLPAPDTDDATLKKLTSLVGVSANSCTREVLKRIPKLKHLEIHVELKPYDDDDERNPLSCLGYISQLQNLVELQYWVRNPEIKYECNTIPLSMFPSSLKVLLLVGLGGYPWNYMNDIGSLLPNLEILKLECYAFRGQEWKITSGSFLKLIELQIDDTDLVRWRPQRGSFLKLRRLSMWHCYKLQQLDWPYDCSWIEVIDLLDCNPLAVRLVPIN
ncbi:late blight resistance protein R1-A-like [Salvia miltiorrhiza]|uniref:late blight resistance protein R1-A-like n=1 Tax=Salvia miltiorrhiza TaxID=226208 RepID=UPI0025AC4E23|nr:late blight resistance protein R1-A-like [Salvia miltiorrhiza]